MLFGFYRRDGILLFLLLPFSRQVAEARSMLFSPNFYVKMAGPKSITGCYLPQEVVAPPSTTKNLSSFFKSKFKNFLEQIEMNK